MRRGKAALQGQSLLEFALILPLLLLFVLGLFDLGYAVFLDNTISNAAREGARMYIVKANDVTAVRTHVIAATTLPDNPDLNVALIPRVASQREFGYPITVTVTYTYTPITPVIGNIVGHIHLGSSSTMIVEGVETVPR